MRLAKPHRKKGEHRPQEIRTALCGIAQGKDFTQATSDQPILRRSTIPREATASMLPASLGARAHLPEVPS